MEAENTFAATTTVSATEHITALLAAADQRYQERYEAQTQAVAQALQAQQAATQAALASAERAITTAVVAAEKAVTKAEVATEKRFDSVNEFRQQLSDQTATFMPRGEAESRLQALTLDYQQRFEAAAAARNFALAASDKAVGKAEIATEKRFETLVDSHRHLLELVGTTISRIEFDALLTRIGDLSSRIDKTEGTAQGKNISLGYLLGAVSLIGIIVNIGAVLLIRH